MKKKLDVYCGKLTPAQVAEGMNAAAANARRLFEDATILLKARRFASAAALAVLSIEESGKVSILRRLALAHTNSDLQKDWKAYRSHTNKNSAWIFPTLFAQGARKLDDFTKLFDEQSDHPFLLDQVKQLSFYTDCLGKTHWSVPEIVIDEPLARMLVKTADLLKGGKYPHTEKEIDLWIEHMWPVWHEPHKRKKALANWYATMQKAHLAPEGINAMEEFVR